MANQIGVNMHNAARAVHGSPDMTWNQDLANFASEWCNYLAENMKFEHSKDSG